MFAFRFRLCLLAFFLLPVAAQAQVYPSKPVRMVVPFGPGGSNDTLTRLVGQKLGEALGQPFVVENRPGAAGNIGAAYVAKADPDGYTLLMSGGAPLAANSTLYANLPYDPIRDFSPIVLIATQPNVLVVPPSVPAGSVQELIKLAKASRKPLSFGSAGPGSTEHIAAELFTMLTGVEMLHVPYKGTGPALTDLLSGQIDLMFAGGGAAIPHIKAGKLKPIAVTTGRRSGVLPAVPTLAESGVSGYEFRGWFGLVAPAGTPKEIVARLNAEVRKAVDGELRARVAEMALDPAGGSPEDFATFLREDIARYAKIVKAAKITPQ